MTAEEFNTIWLNKPIGVTVTIQLEGEEYVFTPTVYCTPPDGIRTYPHPYFEINTIEKTVEMKFDMPDEN